MCSSDLNSVLVRVPLGWNGAMNMIKDTNPADTTEFAGMPSKQTVELRSPDGSADINKLFAGIVVAAEHGLTMENAVVYADNLYVNHSGNGVQQQKGTLESLPASCWESAEALLQKRAIFEKDSVFPSGVIDNAVKKLRSYNDKGLSERLYNRNDEIAELVRQFLHCS